MLNHDATNAQVQFFRALLNKMRHSSAQGVLFSQAIAERLGLNPTDVECLDILSSGGPMAAGELAIATGLTTGAVTTLIDRLAQAGYVRRERDPHDRRRVLVYPQPLMAEIRPLYNGIEQAMATLCASYNPTQLALIADFLDRSQAALAAETAKLRGQTAGKSGEHGAKAAATFAAPAVGIQSAELVFATTCYGITIRAAAGASELYRAHFSPPPANLQLSHDATGAIITVWQISPTQVADTLAAARAEVLVNRETSWGITFQQAAHTINAALTGLPLHALTCENSVEDFHLHLPAAKRGVPLRFAGPVQNLSIQRPAGTAIRLHTKAGASELKLDDHVFAVISGDFMWQTANYAEATEHYDIEFGDSVHDVSVSYVADLAAYKIRWAGASSRSIAAPTRLGVGSDGAVCKLHLY